MRAQTLNKRTVWISLILATLTAIGRVDAAPLPGFALISQTDHFSFYSRDPRLKVQAAQAERCLQEISALLHQPIDGRAEFFRHERPEDLAVYAGVYSTGFAEGNGTRVHSALSNHPHEIVHLVAFRMGMPGDFFQEGLAVALGDHGKVNGVPASRLAKTALARIPVASVVGAFRDVDPTAAYAIAGAFVEHLIQDRGVDKVAEFFRACPNGPTARDAAFSAVFGRSLQSELADWSAAL